ncbi:MAG: TetR/AcrR family transcriptional regulator [Actinomycetota bacterium]|nr:TetR/AcrR family transcriptional regulator [Actinomycetota bacterium]
MPDSVKSRTYRSPLRAEQARQTRSGILAAARRLFTEHGYAATTVAQIASGAGVAVDTVYAAVGAKSVIFRLLLETALSGTDEPVPPEERDYVRRIQAQTRAREKLEAYATAVRAIGERLGPLHLVLRDAAAQAPELARMRDEIASRRAKNMRLLAQDLIGTGDLRPDLDVEEIADVIWSMNSAEFYYLLVHERGWSPTRFEQWLAQTWCQLFLVE